MNTATTTTTTIANTATDMLRMSAPPPPSHQPYDDEAAPHQCAASVVEEAAYYGALYGLMLNMDSQPSPGAGSHNKKRTVVEPTALQLLDGALGDTVDASTPHGEKKEDGVWRTVTCADCYDYDKTTALI